MFVALQKLHQWYLVKRIIRLHKKNLRLSEKLHYTYGTWS